MLADIGCFSGLEVTWTATPARWSNGFLENLYGFDIIDFWDLGFEMFQDRDWFKAHFVQADIMATDSEFAVFKGELDIIYIAQVRLPSQAPPTVQQL